MGLLPLIALHAALAAEPAPGQKLFEIRCGLCHGIGIGSRQGPGLADVVGRAAAGNPSFTYTAALHGSHLTWDRATLDRFLAAPTTTVPGTAMVIATPDAAERASLIDYLATLKATEPAASSTADSAKPRPSPANLAKVRTGAEAFGDYRDDVPGVRRRFTVESLPAPFKTESVNAGPKVVAAPPGATLSVPAGFRIEPYAQGLPGARLLRVAPNGDLFVAQTTSNRISVLRPAPDGSKPIETTLYAKGLALPFGMAFYPPGPQPRWLYVALKEKVVRFAYEVGDLTARGAPEVVVPELSPVGKGGHWTRDLGFSLDGKRMFVSVGSATNVAEDMPREPPGGLASWTKQRALGETWGHDELRADVQVFDPEGKARSVFATGLRNCVGLAVQPQSGDVWCSVNERDELGDDLVPDYVTRVKEGAFYGWPWFYLGAHEDPRLAGARPDLASHLTVPDVLVQPHSAALQLAFYTGTQFPTEYQGDAFVAFHGSWNRTHRTGYKIERIRTHHGVPTGEVEDFVTGFVVDDLQVWGRPVGVAVAADGALLFSEDGHGTIWRVTSIRSGK